MARPRQDLHPAVRQFRPGRLQVGGRNHPVARAPDQQHLPGGEPGQPAAGADRLPTGIDHRAAGGQERPPGVGVGQRGQRLPGLRGAGTDRGQSDPAPEPQRGITHPVQPARGQHRQHEFAAGQRGRPQQRVEFAAQPARADQHQPVDPFGKQVGQLHRDAATQRMPDHRRRRHVQGIEQVAQAGGVRSERVVAQGFVRLAVAEQVGRQHPVVGSQPVPLVRPGGAGAHHPVHQQDRRAGPDIGQGHPVAVQLQEPGLLRHAGLLEVTRR